MKRGSAFRKQQGRISFPEKREKHRSIAKDKKTEEEWVDQISKEKKKGFFRGFTDEAHGNSGQGRENQKKRMVRGGGAKPCVCKKETKKDRDASLSSEKGDTPDVMAKRGRPREAKMTKQKKNGICAAIPKKSDHFTIPTTRKGGKRFFRHIGEKNKKGKWGGEGSTARGGGTNILRRDHALLCVASQRGKNSADLSTSEGEKNLLDGRKRKQPLSARQKGKKSSIDRE